MPANIFPFPVNPDDEIYTFYPYFRAIYPDERGHAFPQPPVLRQPLVLDRAVDYTPVVLIVDDDQFICELLHELLSEAGFAVRVAYDAETAFREACESAPDLILSDYMMPTADDGLQLARRLRAHPHTSHTPLALMSSARPRLSGMEGVPFLPKPFDIDDVLMFVNRHMLHREQLPHGEG